jgi:prophage regulatory protein
MTTAEFNSGDAQTGQSFLTKDRRKDRFLRLKAVTARTGLSISTIYRREISGRFPRRMLIGLRSVAWYESDIDDFMADPIGYRWSSEAEVREAASGPG